MDHAKTYARVGVLIFLFSVGSPALAAVMSSPSYSIQVDSINVGGADSVSPSYKLQETVGEIATGDSESASFAIRAGYQQMLGSSISITLPADVVLVPAIDGTVGGVATGATSVTVTTDNPSGYSLSVDAATSPALVASGDSFADYAPSGVPPDFDFTVSAAQSAFGFSPEGGDVVSAFLDDGATCSVGLLNTADQCWDGFSTSPQTIAQKVSPNAPLGTLTTLKLRAEAGAARAQGTGSYSGSITLTAVAL